MKRKSKIKNVDAIITADWHVTDHQPLCRTDDFWETQKDKITQVKELQNKYKCPIWHAGDLFEKARPPLYVVGQLMKTIPPAFSTILGNHDLPNHNIKQFKKSGIYLLWKSSFLNIFPGQHYGMKTEKYRDAFRRKVTMAHMMVWEGESPWPGCTDPEIHELFDLFPAADLIVTGHNHKTMTLKKGNRLIINPGSLTRHKADQLDHRPCVFLWDAESNTAVPHYLKIKDNVMNRGYIDEKNERDERLQKFISTLKLKGEKRIVFEETIEMLLQQNKVSPKVKQIVNECLGV